MTKNNKTELNKHKLNMNELEKVSGGVDWEVDKNNPGAWWECCDCRDIFFPDYQSYLKGDLYDLTTLTCPSCGSGSVRRGVW